MDYSKCAFCNRGLVTILCITCGHTCIGRARIPCNTHPEIIHLMDYTCCSECKSPRLKECGYVAKTPSKDSPTNKLTSPRLTITIPGQRASTPTSPAERVVSYRDSPSKSRLPLSPLFATPPKKTMETKESVLTPTKESATSPVMMSPQRLHIGIGRGRGGIGLSPKQKGNLGNRVNEAYNRTRQE